MERTEQVVSRIKGVTFDLEGTIINIETIHHNAHLRAAADVGVHMEIEYAIDNLPQFVGGPDEKVAEEIALLAQDSFSTDQFLKSKRGYFEKSLAELSHIDPRDGFKEILRWIHDKGIKTAIGTVTERSFVLKLLDCASLFEEFDVALLVAKEDVESAKPSPDVYIETAHRMGIATNEQLVFEDSIVGVKAGRSAKSRVAAVPTVKSSKYIQSLLKVGAEAVFLGWKDQKLPSFINKLICA